MEKFTDDQLRKELERRGYYTGNLWTVSDVKIKFECTDEEAQDVLDNALQNEATMEQIWLSIQIFGEDAGLVSIEED